MLHTRVIAGRPWSCSNTLLANISATGLLTPVAIGNLNVTAAFSGLTATATVKIL